MAGVHQRARAGTVPVELALHFLDRHIVDGGVPMVHEAVRAELPILVSVGTEPGSGSVVPFISEAHGDAAAIKGPQFLNEPVRIPSAICG